jgi:hypothetical protein
MPQQTPLHPGDPRRIGRYRVGGRISGIPSDDPMFIGLAPDGSEVAISLIRGDWAHDGAARDRFAAEAAVAKRVPPFCAARVLDAGLDGAEAFLVSEYVPGPSLLELVVGNGVQQTPELDAIAIGMATGLASVHQAGLVHGNFGPEYVIMATDGPPRVIEFGITPPYGTATPSADMLAWAETVIFAATGRPPTRLDDVDVLPGHLRGAVELCLGTAPSERPAARAVIQLLLGNEEPAAGLLAEGSRRAARPRAGYGSVAVLPRSPGGQALDRLSADRPGSDRHSADRHSADRHSADRAALRRGTGERPAVHGRLPAPRHSPESEPPAAPHHGPHRAERAPAGGSARRGRTAWLAGAIVVVLAAVAVVVVHLMQNSGSQSADRTTAGSTRSPSQSSSGPPSPTPSLPTAFAGSWSGSVQEPGTQQLENVTIALQTGAAGGNISYSGPADLNCTGQLTLTAANPAQVTLNQAFQGHSKCVNGPVTLTMTSTGRLKFASNGSSGTLRRS